MLQFLYALVASSFSTIKYGLSKTTLVPYANKIGLINMIFIKHIIKTIFYVIVAYLLSPKNLKTLTLEITKLLTETKKSILGLKMYPYFKLILIICLVSIIEIAHAFPFYTGIKKFKLSTYVISITILSIILNLAIGMLVFNETIIFTQYIGIILCLIGVSLIIK